MKNFSTILALFAMVFTLVSCDKDDDSAKQTISYLESLSVTSEGISREYIYNEDKYVTQIVETMAGVSTEYNFEYTSTGIVVVDNAKSFAAVVTLDAAWCINKIEYYDGDYEAGAANITSKFTYIYDTDSYLSQIVESDYVNDVSVTYHYEWTSNNLVSTIESDNGLLYKEVFEYGTTTAPYTNYDTNFMFLMNEFSLFPSVWFGNMPTNLIVAHQIYEPQTSTSGDWTLVDANDYTCDYTFDSNGNVSTFSKGSKSGSTWSTTLSYVK